MIKYKLPWEVEIMRQAGKIAAGALQLAKKIIEPNITTQKLDHELTKYVKARGGEMAFKGYRGYPANICVSINEEVVHGIPGERHLKAGDIVSVDVGVRYKNYYADVAATFPVGNISPRAQKLIETTQEALEKAISKIKPGEKLSEISATIEECASRQGFSVVRQFVGHGIGSQMHEEPQVPNYRPEPQDCFEIILKPGIVLAIEVMINEGTWEVEILPDGWTVVTRDRKLSAHFEHTVTVTENGPEILTIF